MRYFQQIVDGGCSLHTRCKVMLVGDGEMGKTSLLRSLIRGYSSMASSDERTATVDIFESDALGALGVDEGGHGAAMPKFDVWDFGGQQAYHTLQQMVFSEESSLYLLAYDMSQPIDLRSVRFWIHSVASRVPGSIIAIVGTKADLCDPQLLEEKKKQLMDTARRVCAERDANLNLKVCEGMGKKKMHVSFFFFFF